MDLLIIGQTTIDEIYQEGKGLVSKETPGGDAIYAVIGASMWPVKLGVVTRLGMDYPRHKLDSATCNVENTDWGGLRYFNGPSIHDNAFYFADGQRKYIFNDYTLLDTLSPFPEDVPPAMADCRYVHIAPASVESQLELVRFFHNKKATITFDVESHFFKSHEATLAQILALDPIFMPSILHVQQLSGIDSSLPQDLWPWIAGCGCSLVVVKCGQAGAWVFDVRRQMLWTVGVVPGLAVVDTTGAGDSFCGGFLAGLFLTRDPIQAAIYGAVSASFVVESWGAVCPPGFAAGLANTRLDQVRQRFNGRAITLPMGEKRS